MAIKERWAVDASVQETMSLLARQIEVAVREGASQEKTLHAIDALQSSVGARLDALERSQKELVSSLQALSQGQKALETRLAARETFVEEARAEAVVAHHEILRRLDPSWKNAVVAALREALDPTRDELQRCHEKIDHALSVAHQTLGALSVLATRIDRRAPSARLFSRTRG